MDICISVLAKNAENNLKFIFLEWCTSFTNVGPQILFSLSMIDTWCVHIPLKEELILLSWC